jgi:hypothetical protein
MSRRNGRAVERLDPAMTSAVRASGAEQAAEEAVRERADELGTLPDRGGGMLVSRLAVGDNYYVYTSTFPYVGKLVSVGIDYIELTECAMVLVEGRTSVLHLTGTPTNQAEIEPITLPGESVLIPLDVIGCVKPWPHKLFREAI